MKYNHDKLDKISKKLFDSLNDNSIKLDSSHFNVFNINSFLIYNKNFDPENNRVMDIMLYLLDFVLVDGKIDSKNDMDELLLSKEINEEETNKIRTAIWFVDKLRDKFIKNEGYEIDGDFIKIHDINGNYIIDCSIPVVVLGLFGYYSRNKSNDYKDYLNKLKDKFEYDFDNSLDYFINFKKYLKGKKNTLNNVLINEELLNKLNAQLNENELNRYYSLLKEYEAKDKAEKIERKYLINNIKKLYRDRKKIRNDQFIMTSNGLISEMSEMMGIKKDLYDDIDLVIIYSYLLSSVSEDAVVDYIRLKIASNNFVFNSESFDNNIIESCNDFINDISAFNNISDENIRLERISNYFLDFKNELINDDNSMIYRIEDRNRKVISSIRNSIVKGDFLLIDRNKFLLFDNDIYFLGTFNGICDLITRIYYLDDEVLSPTECAFVGLKKILSDDLFDKFTDTYKFANAEKIKYEVRPDVKLVSKTNSRVEMFINGLIFTLVIMLIIVGIIGYIIV